MSDGILEQWRHHELREARWCILPTCWLAEHALRTKIVHHRLEHGGLQAGCLSQRIKGDGFTTGACERSKEFVLLRDARRYQRKRLTG